MSEIRPFRWSVRREFWENRTLYLGPIIVAVFGFFAFMLSTVGMPARRRATMLLEPAKARAAIEAPYDALAMVLIATSFIVAVFYCLDALYSERRDRSILFWKSLPVSDVTTVLAKASIPALVLPALTLVLATITQFIMLLWSTLVLLPSGQAATTWSRFHFLDQLVFMLYLQIVLALWHAPIYGWLLLLSAWARRAIFLWAFLPIFVLSFFEQMAFRTKFIALFLRDRLIGVESAFALGPKGQLQSISQLRPGAFLASPGLWLGLIFAAACLLAAVRLRRNREPI
ncbi:MAG TPA: ABC transporter permease [Thermoanaerobaculia bacterium]|nr:ABC transporter permease [Thermoanaerobaculia bacterium]